MAKYPRKYRAAHQKKCGIREKPPGNCAQKQYGPDRIAVGGSLAYLDQLLAAK